MSNLVSVETQYLNATNLNKKFRLIKSTSFPDYFGEKIISIDKIISTGVLPDRGTSDQRHFGNQAKTLKRLLTELGGLSKHF